MGLVAFCVRWKCFQLIMAEYLTKPKSQRNKIRKVVAYSLRLSKSSSSTRLVCGTILCWWVRLATCLFFIPSLVEDYCESLSWCWVVDIPFPELWQWLVLFLKRFKIHTKSQSSQDKTAKGITGRHNDIYIISHHFFPFDWQTKKGYCWSCKIRNSKV